MSLSTLLLLFLLQTPPSGREPSALAPDQLLASAVAGPVDLDLDGAFELAVGVPSRTTDGGRVDLLDTETGETKFSLWSASAGFGSTLTILPSPDSRSPPAVVVGHARTGRLSERPVAICSGARGAETLQVAADSLGYDQMLPTLSGWLGPRPFLLAFVGSEEQVGVSGVVGFSVRDDRIVHRLHMSFEGAYPIRGGALQQADRPTVVVGCTDGSGAHSVVGLDPETGDELFRRRVPGQVVVVGFDVDGGLLGFEVVTRAEDGARLTHVSLAGGGTVSETTRIADYIQDAAVARTGGFHVLWRDSFHWAIRRLRGEELDVVLDGDLLDEAAGVPAFLTSRVFAGDAGVYFLQAFNNGAVGHPIQGVYCFRDRALAWRRVIGK